MSASLHPLATQPLPIFVPSADGTDYLLVGMAFFLAGAIFAVGLLYLRLHMLPDHIAHRSHKVQYEIVCVLGLLAMFTQVHAFWIAGLLLALIDIPDFSGPLNRISGAVEKLSAESPRPPPTTDTSGERSGRTGVSDPVSFDAKQRTHWAR